MQMDRCSSGDASPTDLPTALPLSLLDAIQQREDGMRQRRVQLVVVPNDLNHHEGLARERVRDDVNEERQAIYLVSLHRLYSRTACTALASRRSPSARSPSRNHVRNAQPLRSRASSPPSSRGATVRSCRRRSESSAETASAPPAVPLGRPAGSPRPRRTPG